MSDLAVAVTVTDSAGLKTSATSAITVTTAAQTVKIGQTTIGPINDNYNGDGIIGQSAVLTQPSTIQSLSIYVAGLGGQVRLGLYSGASSPGQKVAETAAFTPIVGWNTQPTLTTPTLAAGQYWLVNNCQDKALVLTKATVSSPAYYQIFNFGPPLPTTFPAPPNKENSVWSAYATFSIPQPIQPPSGTPIGIGLSNVVVAKPPNANSVVATVKVTTSDGVAYAGQLVLGGADAAKFALTHGGVLPCNLIVGPADIAAGNYNINLTAS